MSLSTTFARKAVLFDLDDTIFDHQHARRSALAALQRAYPVLAEQSISSLESSHEQHMQATFAAFLAGEFNVNESRRERQRLFFRDYGSTLSAAQAEEAEVRYRQAYNINRRPVPGAVTLIDALRDRGIKIGVVTNGVQLEQAEKIRLCGLEGKIDSVVSSGQLKVKKPDKAIFEHALASLGIIASDTIMIGDSWQNDVIGARNAGIPAIWFNRYSSPYPEASDITRVVTIIRLEPTEEILSLLAV
jgi:putative hydrolase of the HAD superfamily